MAKVNVHSSFGVPDELKQPTLDFITTLKNSHAPHPLSTVPTAQDNRVRVGHVDDNHTAVLFQLSDDSHTHFVLIAVDRTEEALAKAARIRLEVNAFNGITSIVDTEPQPTSPRTEAAAVDDDVDTHTIAEQLHALGIDETSLMNELGIPPTTFAHLTTATSMEELPVLPQWERDAIEALLAEFTFQEIRDELDITITTITDTESDRTTLAGLQHPAATMDFAYAADEKTLRSIIDSGDFNTWRIFVHPNQRAIINTNYSGSGRVLGGAGTGKTVVTLHRANRLAQENPHARVLLTTFTRTLADSLKHHMNLLNPEFTEATALDTPGIMISGIDALTMKVLREATPTELNHAMRSALGINENFRPRPLDQLGEQRIWEEAINASTLAPTLPDNIIHPVFLQQEYQTVVVANAITDQATYLKTARPGRGTSLNRSARKAVWEIISLFINKCVTQQTFPFSIIAGISAEIITQRTHPPYDHILIDEAQDFHAGHWRFLRALVAPGRNDIFLAEDSHQRIYGTRLVLSHFGISTRGTASRKLTLNYRTTKQNLDYAVRILEGTEWVSSSEETDDIAGYRSARFGPNPIFKAAATPQEEISLAAAQIHAWQKESKTHNSSDCRIGILTRSRSLLNQVSAGLQEHGITAVESATSDSEVVVMTMHSAKGLEFTHVILLGASAHIIPQAYQLRGLGEPESADVIQRERALLYVAASRARDALMVTYSGEHSELLPVLPSHD